MKKNTTFLIIIILCSALQARAQKEYAILAKGDTLFGKLKLYSFDNLDRLQIILEGKKSTYTAIQVRSFAKDGDVYEPVKYENTIRFMKVIKGGYLGLYAFNISNPNSWDGRYLLKKNGAGMEVPNLSFKKLVAKFLNDCPEVQDRIEKGELPKKDIDKIVNLYNACILNKTNIVTSASSVQPSTFNNEKLVAIKKLSEKVETENFLTKKDVLDLLNDIKSKVSKNEAIPNYLSEGLKSYLADTPSLSKEAEELIILLKK